MLEIAIRIVGFLLAFTGLAHTESLMHADGFWNSGLEAWGYNAQIVLVPIQVAIGLGLLFAPRAEPALTGGTVLLVCFAMYNVVSLSRSTPTCNCLVIADTSPTATFLIDIVCLGVLLLARGKVEEVPRLSVPLLFSCSLGLIVATLGVSYWSPYIVASSGKLVVVPNSRFLGNVDGSDVATRYLRLENRSNRPVRIVGAQSACSCSALVGIPCELAPFERRSLPVVITPNPAVLGVNRVSLIVFTDCPGSRSVSGQIVFNTLGSGKEASASP